MLFFLCCKIFAPKNVFSFLPFYLFVLSHFGLNWCMAVMGETRFYLFHGTRSLPEDLGRYAPVTAAVALTLDRVDRS